MALPFFRVSRTFGGSLWACLYELLEGLVSELSVCLMDTFFSSALVFCMLVGCLLYDVCSELLCLLDAIVLLFVSCKELECSVDEFMKIAFCLSVDPISRVSYMTAAKKLPCCDCAPSLDVDTFLCPDDLNPFDSQSTCMTIGLKVCRMDTNS